MGKRSEPIRRRCKILRERIQRLLDDLAEQGVRPEDLPESPMRGLAECDVMLTALDELLSREEPDSEEAAGLQEDLSKAEEVIEACAREVREALPPGTVEPAASQAIAASPDLARWKEADRTLIEKGMAGIDESGCDAEECLSIWGGPKLMKRVRAGQVSMDDLTLFHDWLWMDYRPSPGAPSIAEQMLARSGISADERAILKARERSMVRPYQIVRIAAGEGVQMEDVLNGKRTFAEDVAMSRSATPWVILFGRIYAAGPYEFIAAGSQAFPPFHKPVIASNLQGWYEDARKDDPALSLDDFLKGNPEVFGKLIEELIVHMEKPPFAALANTEGHRLAPSLAEFEVTDLEKALAELRKDPEFHEVATEAGEHRFEWAEPGWREAKTILGFIVISPREATLECNSRQRLKRGVRRLSTVAGLALRREATWNPGAILKKMKDLWKHRSALRREDSEPRPQEFQEAEREWKRRYYEEEWIRTAVPALGGMTPENAAKDSRMRTALVDLLREIEYGEGTLPEASRYEVGRLRKLLRIEDA